VKAVALIAVALIAAAPVAQHSHARVSSPVCAAHFVTVRTVAIKREITERIYGEQWDEVVADLEREGFHVQRIEQVERRYESGVDVSTIDAVLRVGKEIAADVVLLGSVVELLRRALRGRVKVGPRRGQKRRVDIVGPDGETLREVEVPDDE
jgi:hypothetical protein